MPLSTRRPVVIFDTSAVNAIYDDLDRDKKTDQLLNIYFPRLTFAVLDEILATPDAYRRAQLFDLTLKLQNAGDCILPFHHLFINHVKAFVCEREYDWTVVNCRGNSLKKAIIDERHGLGDSLIEEQRKQNRELEYQFKRRFRDIRGRLQEDGRWKDRFPSLGSFISFGFAEDGPYWREAVAHVKRAIEICREEEESKAQSDSKVIEKLKNAANEFCLRDAMRFAESSPPFRAHIYGIACSAYSRVHDPLLTSKQRETAAGRIDTFTSLYLPYCRYFVTNDDGQFNCHNNVVALIGTETQVHIYRDFWQALPYE
ncbi:MAG: hypothetical protein ACLGSD_18025 [Acidobacteriota bacterium]